MSYLEVSRIWWKESRGCQSLFVEDAPNPDPARPHHLVPARAGTARFSRRLVCLAFCRPARACTVDSRGLRFRLEIWPWFTAPPVSSKPLTQLSHNSSTRLFFLHTARCCVPPSRMCIAFLSQRMIPSHVELPSDPQSSRCHCFLRERI